MGRKRGGRVPCLRRPKRKRNNNTAADSSSSAPPPPLIELPRYVTANILGRNGPEEILDTAERECTTWRSVCSEPYLWRIIDTKKLWTLYRHDRTDSLCLHAVDRSQGEVIEISIKRFGSNDLLGYISERLRHLKNLSSLEELHLFLHPEISDLDIETIGVSCPMMNSFIFNKIAFRFQLKDIYNSLAFSIAKSMPNLPRLCLVRNLLNNEGLVAILDGCPNLEFLNLLQCLGVDLRGYLGWRCSQQIKELKRPFTNYFDNDPMNLMVWNVLLGEYGF